MAKRTKQKAPAAPGRIEPKRRIRTWRGLLIRLLLAIIVFLAMSAFISLYFKLSIVDVSTVVGFVVLIFVAPGAVKAFSEEAIKTKNDPARRLAGDARAETRKEKQRAQRAAKAAKNAPGEADDVGVLGGAHTGTLSWAIGPYAVLPQPELAKHGVVIGASGSGKTVSLLRLAFIAANFYDYRVFFIDGKGDRDTAAEFVALMRYLGYDTRMFPRQTYNGWRGDGPAILNRLMSVVDFSEPYYRDATRDALTAVCLAHPDGPPRSSKQLLERLDARLALDSKNRALEGAVLRYRSFFGALGGALDNGFSWEDAPAAYMLLDGLALKEQAASLGRFLIEDFAHYAARRKKKGRDLLIVDEFSAISDGTDAANLIERIRSYGCAVILSSQSYAGLGPQRDAERILDAANFLLLHRTAAPERLTGRAGTQEVKREWYQSTPRDYKTHGNTRTSLEEEAAVHPDEARRLTTGEALLIAQGQYLRLMMAQPPELDAGTVRQTRAWIDQTPAPLMTMPPLAPRKATNGSKPQHEGPELI